VGRVRGRQDLRPAAADGRRPALHRLEVRHPANAWAFHLAHNWYDDGGWLPPGVSLAVNGTGKPERVVGPNDARGGQLTGNLYLDSGQFIGIVRGEIREGKRQDAIADRRRYGR
jgi:hypothetical protein